jgi:beta-1,4-mannosyltransferase
MATPIKVLTPVIAWHENQYLTCLWSSIMAQGAQVSEFELRQLMLQVNSGQKVGDVVHLQWIHHYCRSETTRGKWVKQLEVLCRALNSLSRFAILRLKGYQLVWTVHNTLSHEPDSSGVERFFRQGLSYLCNDIIVMSEYSRQEFKRLYRRTKRVHVIPHGNYIDAYPNTIDRETARQRLNILPHQKVLLHIGQIKPYKGVDELIAAFNRINDPDAILLIAGSCSNPDLAAELQQAAEKNPKIMLRLEFIPDEEIQLYLNACDWVALTYRKILNSGSALLALSFKRPVIATNKGSLSELITNGETGFLFEQPEDLVKAIDHALATPIEKWEQMCDRAYAVAQQYDWKTIGSQICNIYRQKPNQTSIQIKQPPTISPRET